MEAGWSVIAVDVSQDQVDLAALLASRSTTQNELLVRIAIFLTLVSASIIALALVGQATDFDGRFDAFAIFLTSILVPVGTLMLLRVA